MPNCTTSLSSDTLSDINGTLTSSSADNSDSGIADITSAFAFVADSSDINTVSSDSSLPVFETSARGYLRTTEIPSRRERHRPTSNRPLCRAMNPAVIKAIVRSLTHELNVGTKVQDSTLSC